MTAPAPDELLPALHKAAADVAADAAKFSDSEVQAPSALPGWTRGHVLAHLTGISNAMARQLEYAARGEAVELYDGGMEGRNKAIDMAAGHDAATHRADLTAALDRARSRIDAGQDDPALAANVDSLAARLGDSGEAGMEDRKSALRETLTGIAGKLR